MLIALLRLPWAVLRVLRGWLYALAVAGMYCPIVSTRLVWKYEVAHYRERKAAKVFEKARKKVPALESKDKKRLAKLAEEAEIKKNNECPHGWDKITSAFKCPECIALIARATNDLFSQTEPCEQCVLLDKCICPGPTCSECAEDFEECVCFEHDDMKCGEDCPDCDESDIELEIQEVESKIRCVKHNTTGAICRECMVEMTYTTASTDGTAFELGMMAVKMYGGGQMRIKATGRMVTLRHRVEYNDWCVECVPGDVCSIVKENELEPVEVSDFKVGDRVEVFKEHEGIVWLGKYCGRLKKDGWYEIKRLNCDGCKRNLHFAHVVDPQHVTAHVEEKKSDPMIAGGIIHPMTATGSIFREGQWVRRNSDGQLGQIQSIVDDLVMCLWKSGKVAGGDPVVFAPAVPHRHEHWRHSICFDTRGAVFIWGDSCVGPYIGPNEKEKKCLERGCLVPVNFGEGPPKGTIPY